MLLSPLPDVSRRVRRLTPWGFAAVITGVVCSAVFAVGWFAEGDPGSGIARAVFEAAALLGCFGLLRRPLALASDS